jgi:enoyl-CoA hydratase/carnithine racemase
VGFGKARALVAGPDLTYWGANGGRPVTDSFIKVRRDGGVTHIEMNRPDKRNAITVAMYDAMAGALEEAEHDETVVVLISGTGTSFCGGNDLADFMANRPEGPTAPVFRFLRAISTSSRILVAAVQGPAVGIGTTMLLHCDLVVAAEDTTLHMPFVDLAIVPEAASSLLVGQVVGHQRASALLLLGEKLDARQALRLGLVNQVVAPGAALAAAQAIAARLMGKPRSALLATKRLMKSKQMDVAARIEEENQVFGAQLKTPDFAAVVEHFFATRIRA